MSRWWRRLLPWERRDDDLDAEIRAHLEMATRDRVAAGQSRPDAEAAARRELGNPLLVREVTQDVWGWSAVERLLQDVRFGLRLLWRSPGFTAAATLTLALGIGANTTVFSVANALLFRPLPFHDPDRLTLLWPGRRDDPERFVLASAPVLRDWQERSRTFERIGAFDAGGRGYNVSSGGESEQVSGSRVTAGFFATLGIAPLLGRTFEEDEETFGASRLVVLSHGLWRRRYAADPGLIGRTIGIDGVAHTVVGVMPPEFQFQFWGGARQLFVLAGFTENDRTIDGHSWVVLARLAPNATLASARAEMDSLGSRLSEEHPQEFPNATVRVMPVNEWGVTDVRATLRAVLAIVGFVLLIACVNVANLSLARAGGRQREIGIRRALGAGRLRIARQLLTESLLLALLGGGAGLLLAASIVRVLPSVLPGSLRFVPMRPLEQIALDLPVLLFTLGVSTLTGLVFGLAPAIGALRGREKGDLTGGPRGASSGSASTRLRGLLMASEVALTLVVMSGAGLMISTVRHLLAVDPGLDATNVLVTGMSLPQEETFVGPPGLERFCADLEEQVGAVPGVVSVGAIAHLPLSGANAGRQFTVDGQPPPDPANVPAANYSVACPNTLRTLAIPLVEGREFTGRDVVGAPDVAVVNRSFADKHWPGQSALGQRFKLGGPESAAPWFTVVGVHQDVRHWGLDQGAFPAFLRPYQQAAWPDLNVVTRTRTAPRAFEEPVREALARVAPRSPVSFVRTMQEVVDGSVDRWRFPMLALGAFALIALTLAAVGVAGVIGHSVSQRTREIGVRMSLGARPGDVLRLVVEGSMAWTVIGLALGLGGCAMLLRLLNSLLFRVSSTDPLVLVVASAVLLGTALAASAVPARQAARVDPVAALRTE